MFELSCVSPFFKIYGMAVREDYLADKWFMLVRL